MDDSRFWVMRCNAADAAAAWKLALPLLAPAIARSGGLYEPADVEALVTGPHAGTPAGWSLWLIGEKETLLGAWVTRVCSYPRERVIETVFGGGGDMARWFPTARAEMDSYATETGCTRLRCAGRPGFTRYGYRRLGHIMERRIA